MVAFDQSIHPIKVLFPINENDTVCSFGWSRVSPVVQAAAKVRVITLCPQLEYNE